MARYIDADKTLDLMWNALYKYEDEDEKKNGLNITRLYVQNGFEIAHKVVVDAPTEDVAPVIHSHWRLVALNTWVCTNCYYVVERRSRKTIYCPDCGAKMDEGEL